MYVNASLYSHYQKQNRPPVSPDGRPILVSHKFSEDIQIELGVWLPRVEQTGWIGFYYFVEIDQEEAVLLGLALTYPKGSPLTTEVIRENQIIGGRIAF